ncbi:hypothetical protein C1N55_17700 [Lysinibacillus sp. SGAir0095]|nr:hypothetical protein C1N55_17700 [Lysinibacillus sp. SGAir0095]
MFSKYKDASIKNSLPKYIILAIFVMMANFVVIDFYYSIAGVSLFFAKILAETTIFFFSYWFQRKYIFVK